MPNNAVGLVREVLCEVGPNSYLDSTRIREGVPMTMEIGDTPREDFVPTSINDTLTLYKRNSSRIAILTASTMHMDRPGP